MTIAPPLPPTRWTEPAPGALPPVPGTGRIDRGELGPAQVRHKLINPAKPLVADALHRNESCGGHIGEESQAAEGEAGRDDEHFSYVAA